MPRHEAKSVRHRLLIVASRELPATYTELSRLYTGHPLPATASLLFSRRHEFRLGRDTCPCPLTLARKPTCAVTRSQAGEGSATTTDRGGDNSCHYVTYAAWHRGNTPC